MCHSGCLRLTLEGGHVSAGKGRWEQGVCAWHPLGDHSARELAHFYSVPCLQFTPSNVTEKHIKAGMSPCSEFIIKVISRSNSAAVIRV